MTITAKNSGIKFDPVPAGLYMARCYSMVHIGTVKENFKGEDKMMNKVRISWELPTELKEFKEGEGKKPLAISKEFTLSMNEKANLRKFLEGWRGKGFSEEQAKEFDVSVLIGKACMLNVIHKTSGKGTVYADISSCTVIMKGAECSAQVNPSFEFNYDPFDKDKFSSLPQFIKDKVVQSDEYKALFKEEAPADAGTVAAEGEESVPAPSGDDLPF